MLIDKDIAVSDNNVPKLCEAVWRAQVSHALLEQINAEIEELLERVLSHPPLDSAEHESFAAAKYRPFVESSSNWRMLFMQMLLTLPGESMVAFLRNRLLSPSMMSNGFNLSVLLPMISTIVVCCKRGTWLLINLIRDIFMDIFSSTPVKNSEDVSNQIGDLAALLDDSASSLASQSSAITSADPVEWKFIQLYHAFFLVRQLSAEDSRVTAFCFTQWWRESFSTSPVPQKEGCIGGVLATRRSLELFAKLLTRLLPFERNPVHLAAQLGAPSPFWTWSKERNGSSDKEEMKEEECCRAWNVYIDVARGRLAELRMERENAIPESPENTTGLPSEVESLVEDFMKIGNCDGDVGRLPSSLVEMHLFRGQFLRDTVLPLLRSPPPNISEEQRIACGILLHTIETHFFRSSTSVSGGPPRVLKKVAGGKRARPRK
ncbi:hypothetical protein Aperf_G00000113033 [Anoplocephala perfoliata]